MAVTGISFQEVYEAYTVYRRILKLPRNKNSRLKFFKFLGFAEADKHFQYQEWMTEEPVRKIKWLIGPHALAMYRVWEVQHEQQRTDQR